MISRAPVSIKLNNKLFCAWALGKQEQTRMNLGNRISDSQARAGLRYVLYFFLSLLISLFPLSTLTTLQQFEMQLFDITRRTLSETKISGVSKLLARLSLYVIFSSHLCFQTWVCDFCPVSDLRLLAFEASDHKSSDLSVDRPHGFLPIF